MSPSPNRTTPLAPRRAALRRAPRRSSVLIASLAACALLSLGCGAAPPPAAPTLASLIAAELDSPDQDSLPPAAQVIVRRGPDLLVHARRGVADDEEPLYRIASLSKIVTSLAVLASVERGLLHLDQPVSDLLPELSEVVEASTCEDGDALATCARSLETPITLRHLLAHTAGIPYPRETGSYVERLYTDRGLTNGARRTSYDVQELVAKLSPLVVEAPPGTAFTYGLATDLLGAVLERAHGRILDNVLDELVLTPLGMAETTFRIPEPDRPRLVPLHEVVHGRARPLPHGADVLDGYGYTFDTSYPTDPHHLYESGGGGLVSTAADLSHLAAYLATGDTPHGSPVVSDSLRHEMMRGQLDGVPTGIEGVGFGLGIGVSLDRVTPAGDPAAAFWSGLFFTNLWALPACDVSVVFVSQVRPDQRGPTAKRVFRAVTDFFGDTCGLPPALSGRGLPPSRAGGAHRASMPGSCP